jgi:hypothetical protein
MRIADAEPDVQRNVLIGAGAGYVVLGALAFIANSDAYDGRVANGLVGCGLGAFAGAVIAFTTSTRVRPWGF